MERQTYKIEELSDRLKENFPLAIEENRQYGKIIELTESYKKEAERKFGGPIQYGCI